MRPSGPAGDPQGMMFVVLALLIPVGALIGWQYARRHRYPPARVRRHAVVGGLIGAAAAVVIMFGLALMLGIALSEMDG